MSAFYEPWPPQIGQRVRVSVSPECTYCNPEEHNGTGTVSLIDPIDLTRSYRLAAHRIWVTLDTPLEGYERHQNYAAIELEPAQ